MNFDNTFSLSSGTKDPLPVATVSFRGGKKHRATIISRITCLWDSRDTDSTNEIRHNKPYNIKMRYNKLG